MESIALKYIRGKISKGDYLTYCISEIDLSEQCKGLESCEDFIKCKLENAFWELDKLDRSDVFWTQTNKLPTLHKLHEYAEYQIKKNDNLVNAAWLKIASDLSIMSQHLKLDPWKILKENNELDIPLLVTTAWNVSGYWMDENIITFSKRNYSPPTVPFPARTI